MSNLEKEVRDLREQNHELVQAVQNWKMVAGEKEKHILKLTKETNDLRIQISILRNKGSACARKLETALQIISETALTHLVQGSNAVASIMELMKNYMIEREEIEISSRQSLIDTTPNTERVQRVPPLMLGGKSIQPVVSLSRAMLPNNSLTGSQGSNENHSGQVRPLPMRVLQEIYIPLTRIDADMTPPDIENNHDTSVEDMGLDESDESEEEDGGGGGANTPRDDRREELSILLEESEESRTPSIADPLEGPSRLLEPPNFNGPRDQSTREFSPTMRRRRRISSPSTVEASPILMPHHVIPRADPLEGPSRLLDSPNFNGPRDQSTREFTPTMRRRKRISSPSTVEASPILMPHHVIPRADPLEGPSRLLDSPNFNGPRNQSTREFTPTMRRRKRISSPSAVEASPILIPRHVIPRHKTHGRILKVVVAKMRFDNDNAGLSPLRKEKMEARKSDKNGSSQDIETCEKPSSSPDEPLSPWQNTNSPRDKSVPPWERPGSSKDKHVSPWNNPESSRDGSPWNNNKQSGDGSPWNNNKQSGDGLPWNNNKQSQDGSPWEKPGPSRNESNSPFEKAGSALQKANTSLENDCVNEVSPHLPSQESEDGNSHKPLLKYRCQKRTVSRDNTSFGESSPSNLRIPMRVMQDRRKPKTKKDIYRFSTDSQNSEEFDAPSPNGSTNTRVIVQEARVKMDLESRTAERSNTMDSVNDSSEDVPKTRTRRARKPVVYKENIKGKLRR
ncbi:uncharacterized protein LOC125051065 isoform X2 [Pieris napi]|uniref:uncharacterized protein LOC125051065 isoform X2 n=1 Tax=Pieris napi TaxID=78633 RepID=UPI001FBBC5AD|nr:uncharacterized protein LOC125051065 isoform X2 [Pieris napi]